jgi:hypothetical protein
MLTILYLGLRLMSIILFWLMLGKSDFERPEQHSNSESEKEIHIIFNEWAIDILMAEMSKAEITRFISQGTFTGKLATVKKDWGYQVVKYSQSIIVDGEIVVLNKEGYPEFGSHKERMSVNSDLKLILRQLNLPIIMEYLK